MLWSLWTVLYDTLQLDIRLVLGMVFGYALVCVFYLVVFYSVMLRKDVIVNNVDLLKQVSNLTSIDLSNVSLDFQLRSRIPLLSADSYTRFYIGMFVVACVLVVVVVIFTFVEVPLSRQTKHLEFQICQDINALGRGDYGEAGVNVWSLVYIIGFFVADWLLFLVVAVFCLNVAFKPVSIVNEVEVKSGRKVCCELINVE